MTVTGNRKLAFLLPALAILLSLASCVMTGDAEVRLGAGEIRYVDVVDPGDDLIDVAPFWKTNALYVMLNKMGLQKGLDLEQKRELMGVLFDALPRDMGTELLREVAIGRFFADGAPLQVRIMSIELDKDLELEEDHEGIYVFITNAIPTFKGGEFVGFKEGNFENVSKNVTFGFVMFENGKFVDTDYALTDEEIEERIEKYEDDPFKALINRIDIYILDQKEENDAEIPALLEEAMADFELDAFDEALVYANVFQYNLMVGDLEAAEVALGKAMGLAKAEPDLAFYFEVLCAQLVELMDSAGIR